MKIIILGAGSVGTSVAEVLQSEQNDIVLIDQDSRRLQSVQDRLDVGAVVGHASYPHILRKAGIEGADMVIAVTDNDETNMIACQLAYYLFNTPTKVCRLRSSAYLQHSEIFNPENIPIDFIISPQRLVTTYIQRLLEYPGSLQVVDFAEDKIRLAAVNANINSPLLNKQLKDIPELLPNIETRIAAIYRAGRAISLDGETTIQFNDEVFFIATREHIASMIQALHGLDKPYKRIMIAAGSNNIGRKLAQSVEHLYQTKIIDPDLARCEQLSEDLQKTLVLNAHASDRELLINEEIDSCDVFLALTDDDETNIMASLLAKKLGAKKVFAVITNMAYVDLLQGGPIDVALSPQQITIGSLLRHVRRGEVSNVYSLRRGVAEAIEITARGNKKNSKIVGRKIEDIPLPAGVNIGAIARGEDVIMAHNELYIETDDHVILFLANKNKIREVEKLFQVNTSFL